MMDQDGEETDTVLCQQQFCVKKNHILKEIRKRIIKVVKRNGMVCMVWTDLYSCKFLALLVSLVFVGEGYLGEQTGLGCRVNTVKPLFFWEWRGGG